MTTYTVTREILEANKTRALNLLSQYTGPEYTGDETDQFLQLLDRIDPSIHLAAIARSNKMIAEMDRLGVDSLEIPM